LQITLTLTTKIRVNVINLLHTIYTKTLKGTFVRSLLIVANSQNKIMDYDYFIALMFTLLYLHKRQYNYKLSLNPRPFPNSILRLGGWHLSFGNNFIMNCSYLPCAKWKDFGKYGWRVAIFYDCEQCNYLLILQKRRKKNSLEIIRGRPCYTDTDSLQLFQQP